MKSSVLTRGTFLCAAALVLHLEAPGGAAAADAVAEAAYGDWLIRSTGVPALGATSLDVPSVRPAIREIIVSSASASVIAPKDPAPPLPLAGVEATPLFDVGPAPLEPVGPAPLEPVGTLPLSGVESTPLLPVEPQLPAAIDPQLPSEIEVGSVSPLDEVATADQRTMDPIVGFPLDGSPNATVPVTKTDRVEGPYTIMIDGVMAKCDQMAEPLRRRFARCDEPLVPAVVPRTPATSAPAEPEVAVVPPVIHEPGTIELVPDAPAPAAGEAMVIVNGRPVSCALLPETLRAKMASCRLGTPPDP